MDLFFTLTNSVRGNLLFTIFRTHLLLQVYSVNKWVNNAAFS